MQALRILRRNMQSPNRMHTDHMHTDQIQIQTHSVYFAYLLKFPS